jgi:hypothetical protein
MLPEARVEVVETPEYTINAATDEGDGDVPEVVLLNCPGCGAPLDTGASHCTYCGARVQISADGTRVFIAGMTCRACGWDNAADRLFCGQCGANLMERCHKCGRPNAISLQYCGGCGMERGEARRQALELRVQQAKDNGWVLSPEDVPEYTQLLQTVALPDETVIMFYRRKDFHVHLRDDHTGEEDHTAFVTTDRSFIFVSPVLDRTYTFESPVKGWPRPPVAKRVPFDEVKSLTVDQRKGDLVISYEGGQARFKLEFERSGNQQLDSLTMQEQARGTVYYFKPFLPLRLQQDW